MFAYEDSCRAVVEGGTFPLIYVHTRIQINGKTPTTARYETSYADMGGHFLHTSKSGTLNDKAIAMGRYDFGQCLCRLI